MTDALSQQIGAWWRVADHTQGNETGRMLVVNGYNPGAVFFRAEVAVEPNHYYLFTAWILNLFKVTGYPDPEPVSYTHLDVYKRQLKDLERGVLSILEGIQ